MALSRSRQKWRFIRLPNILFSKLIVRIMGWRISYIPDRSVLQAVIVVAPHTSNWDFIIGRICYNALDIRVGFLIKKEWFIFPFGLLLRIMGGLPVDRKNPGNLKKMLAKKYSKYDEFMLAITPEGTRKPNSRWKKGFYHIAMDAKVPMVLTYLDYGKKHACVGKLVHPTGNYKEDMQIISEYFSTVEARHPENFLLHKF